MSRQLRSGTRRGLSAQCAFLAKATALAITSTAFLSHTANAEIGDAATRRGRSAAAKAAIGPAR